MVVGSNSNKIRLPRQYIQNWYPNTTKSVQELLHLACLWCTDTPERAQFQKYLEEKSLELSKKHVAKVSAFNISQSSSKNARILYTIINKPLKVLPVTIKSETFVALMDTGASSSLMSQAVADYVIRSHDKKDFKFYPINIDIACPSGIVKDAVIGILHLNVQFWSPKNKQFCIALDFLVSKAIGTWSLVLGNNVLMSENLDSKISTTHISIQGTEIPTFSAPLGDFDGMILNQGRTPGGQVEVAAVGCLITWEKRICSTFVNIPPYVINPVPAPFIKISDFTATGKITLKKINSKEIARPPGLGEPLGFFQFPKPQRQNPALQANNSAPALQNLIMGQPAEESFDHMLTELPDPEEYDILNLQELTFRDGDFTSCSDTERVLVLKTCGQFEQIFAKNKMDLGRTDYLKHHIQIDPSKDHKSQKQRHLGGVRLKFAKASIKIWVEMGIVSKCAAPRFKSNLILVPRAQGEAMDNSKAGAYHAKFNSKDTTPNFRLVVDHTSLNDITINQQSPNSVLPDTIVKKLMGKKVTLGDLSLAYYNLELTDSSRPWTCFYLENEVYQFNRLSMGVSSAPATFVRFISMVFSQEVFSELCKSLCQQEKDLINNFCGFQDFLVSYFDDFWIFTVDCINTHVVCLKLTFLALQKAGIKLSPKKCVYFTSRVKVLGLQVDTFSQEMLMDFKKSESILSWPKPASLGEVSSRLHCLNYWSKFLPYLRYILSPFYLMVRGNKFFWDDTTELCWAVAKAVLFADIRLSVPTEEDQLIMTSDASKCSCSQLLFKRNGKGKISLVASSSRIFSYADQRREIHYKELISLCLGFRSYYQYFLASSKPIVVLVDAINLISIAREKDRNILASNLLSFVQKMCQAFRFNVFYCPGELNYLANVFSRAFAGSRFHDQNYKFSKEFIKQVPKLDPSIINSEILYTFLSSEMDPHPQDLGDRAKSKPKTLEECMQFYDGISPEHCFASAITLLKEVCRNLTEQDMHNFPDSAKLNVTKLRKEKARELCSKGATSPDSKKFQAVLLQIIEQIIEATFGLKIKKAVHTKVKQALMENARKMLKLQELDKGSIHWELEQLVKEREGAQAARDISDLQKIIQESGPSLAIDSSKAMLPSLVNHTQIYNGLDLADPPGSDSLSQVKYMTDGPYPPSVAHEGDAGIDLFIQYGLTLLPGKTTKINTYIRLLLPNTATGIIYKRSSAAKLPISVHMGVIDPTYTGFIFIVVKNTGCEPVTLPQGVSVAQVVLHKIHKPALVRSQDFQFESQRGEKGFGSSGHAVKLSNIVLTNVPPEEQIHLENVISQVCGIQVMAAAESFDNCTIEGPPGMDPPNLPLAFNFLRALEGPSDQLLPHAYVVQTRATTKQGQNQSAPAQKDVSNAPQPGPSNQTLPVTLTQQGRSPYELNPTKEEALTQLVIATATADTTYILQNKLSKEAFAVATKQCDRLGKIFQDLKAGVDHKGFVVINDLLFKNYQGNLKLCIPDSLIISFLHTMHIKNNHDSKNHLANSFFKDFFHPRTKDLVQDLIDSCVTCKYTTWSFGKKTVGQGRAITPQRPREYVSIDCIPKLVPSSDGLNTYTDMLVVLDNFSLYVWAFPMQDRKGPTIAKTLLAFMADGTMPKVIMSDGETGLLSGLQAIGKKFPNIQIVVSPPFTPWQNSCERAVGQIKKNLLKLVYNETSPHERADWVQLLPWAAAACNSAIIKRLNISRIELHFNRRHIGIFKGSEMEDFMDSNLPDDTVFHHKIPPAVPANHKFVVGDLVILKDDAPPPIGVSSTLRPKTKIRIYFVQKVLPDSANLVIQDTQSEEQRTVPTIKLVPFVPGKFFPLYKRDLINLEWLRDPNLQRKIQQEEGNPSRPNQDVSSRKKVRFAT